jgi:hypothetical protein
MRAPRSWVAKAVAHAMRGSDDRPCGDPSRLSVVEKFDLAVEDEHRVDVIVSVGRDLEGGVELDLVNRELRELDPDRDDPVLANESLPFPRSSYERALRFGVIPPLCRHVIFDLHLRQIAFTLL